jgi:hypothetical protein
VCVVARRHRGRLDGDGAGEMTQGQVDNVTGQRHDNWRGRVRLESRGEGKSTGFDLSAVPGGSSRHDGEDEQGEAEIDTARGRRKRNRMKSVSQR